MQPQYRPFSVLLAGLLTLFLTFSSALAAPRIDTVYPAVGEMGVDLDVTITGSGFDGNTRISFYPDTLNKSQIIGDLKIQGVARGVCVAGDMAYLANGYEGLRVIDISTPSMPVSRGSVPTQGSALAVSVSGTTACVADGYGGLQVIDVSNPDSPSIIRSVTVEGGATDVTDVELVGNTAYVVWYDTQSYAGGLQIIDITSPSSPSVLASLDMPGGAMGVAVADNRAYVAWEGDLGISNGLRIIDVSTPSNPSELGGIDTLNAAAAVAVVGDTAYVVGGWGDGSLHVIDVSTPSSPVLRGSVFTGGLPGGVTVLDGNAYVACGYGGGFQVIDVSTPSNPIKVATVDTPGGASDVAVLGDSAYVADGEDGGLQVIDVRALMVPMMIGGIQTPGIAGGLALSDGTAYVAASGGEICSPISGGEACWIDEFGGALQVIDVSTPPEPSIVRTVDTTVENTHAGGVAVVNDTAYLAGGDNGGLKIIDISVPASAGVVGEMPGAAISVTVVGNLAYVAAGAEGLRIIDVASPSNPSTEGFLDTDGYASGVAVSGNVAYVADGYGGLRIIDVGTPSNSTLLQTVDTPGDAYGVTVAGNTAYVACGSNVDVKGGMRILDISTPSNPEVLGFVETPGAANVIRLSGDTAYVAWGGMNDAGGGIQVVDVSTPSNPLILGAIDTQGRARDIRIVGDTAYVSDESQGLTILLLPVSIQPTQVTATSITATLPSPPVQGHYTISVLSSTDRDELLGAVSFLESVEYEPISRDKAIIVTGRNGASDPLWPYTRLNANHAYKTLLFRGYTHDTVHFLSPETVDVDGDGENDVDLNATVANLDAAFNTWAFDSSAPAHGLVVYLVGHGGAGQFGINATETVSSQDLANWLDAADTHCDGRVVFIYDGCLSGSVFDSLATGTTGRRIVMTSTSRSEWASFLDGGEKSFSYRFWYDIFEGYKIGPAFDRARDEMRSLDQSALIYNDALAKTVYIGVDKVMAPIGPRIGTLSPESLTLSGATTATISVAVSSPNGVKYVKAIIIPPNLSAQSPDDPVIDLPEITLTDPENDGTYEGTYNGFTQKGTYTITISAKDKEDLRAYDPNRIITVVQEVASTLPGDLNGDGDANLADVITALQAVTDNTLQAVQKGADLTGDDRIGVEDAVALLRRIGG